MRENRKKEEDKMVLRMTDFVTGLPGCTRRAEILMMIDQASYF